MFEVWAKRKEEPKWEFVTNFENVNSSASMLDALDTEGYDEAIVLYDNKYIMIKVYEKGKVLRK